MSWQRTQERERGEGGDAHLYMSLLEFPLYLISIPSVEVGLDGDGGPGILFHTSGSFVLDIHTNGARVWR